jgi:Transglycosylase SLT domain
MRNRLLLTIALGVVLTAFAAGTAASVDNGGGTGASVPVDPPPPACSNEADDDSDGLTDLADPGCSSADDNDESDDPAPDPGSGSGDGSGTSGGSTGGTGPGGSGTGSSGGGGGSLPASSPGATGKVQRAPVRKKEVALRKGIFGSKKAKGKDAAKLAKAERKKIEQPVLRNPDGSPSARNPGLTIAPFGPAPIGVPNPVIDAFEIPPFLLPIYQSCGTEYGIPWQVLASINKIETAFGTNLNVSSAGAMGWMQFIPSSWKAYGVDANDDKRSDPYNPVDAICAAARYLRAAGGDKDLRTAIYAYNHADWYVDEVLLYANQYGKLPAALVGSLTGLTEGAHFPVAADARYADDIDDAAALERSRTPRRVPGNAADVIADNAKRRSINIYSSLRAPVVAANDGVIRAIGENERLGKFIVLQDVYGNRYTYSDLGHVARVHAVPKQRPLTPDDFKITTPRKDAAPAAPASAGNNSHKTTAAHPASRADGPSNTEGTHDRLFALPNRPANADRASLSGQLDRHLDKRVAGYATFKGASRSIDRFDPENEELRPLKVGSHVTGGSVIGRVGKGKSSAPHLNFAIRPAGRGAPTIDPKPILDGWKLLETTAIYRAQDKDPFASNPSVGEALMASKATLMQRVLADPSLSIYECGRQDILSGQIDRRVLAALEYLVAKGYRLTITSLKCGHSYLTASGNVSAHSYGAAVDIAAVDGIPILGNQGKGSLTEAVISDLMMLQGTMRPAQIISLMEMGPPTFALPDHDDHIHVGYTFTGKGQLEQLAEILKPEQWQRLIDRLGEIPNPDVPSKPSDAALPAGTQASEAHTGE